MSCHLWPEQAPIQHDLSSKTIGFCSLTALAPSNATENCKTFFTTNLPISALTSCESFGAAPAPVQSEGDVNLPLPARLQTEALHLFGPAPHCCHCGIHTTGPYFNERKLLNRTIDLAMDISKMFDIISHCLLIEMILWDLPLRPEGDLPLATAPFAFPPVQWEESQGIYILPVLLNPFSPTIPSLTLTWHPMPMTSWCWPLLPALSKLRRRQTRLWISQWNGLIGSN